MLRNYILIAWRNLVKHRFYASVNIIGLSAGLTFTLLISAFLWTELQVNAHLKNADRQYIIQSKWKDPNQGIELTSVGPLAKALKEQYPSLVSNFYRWDGITTAISKGDKSFREGIQIGDSTMLDMYGFRLLYGDPGTAFEGPFSLVLSKEKAIKYFGRTDVVGQTLTVESFSGSRHDFMITGVMEKPEKNSVTFITEENDNQFFTSSSNAAFFGRDLETWNNQYIVNFIELKQGIDPSMLDQPMKHLLQQNAPPETAASLHPYLVSLHDYYISANNGLIRKLLVSLSAIAFFILLMAVINFVNMSISHSTKRMREIGIRKVLGGMRRQLIFQFLIESSLIVFISAGVALLIYTGVRNLFGEILGDNLPRLSSFPLVFITYIFILILSIGLLAGLYPAFVLSSLRSVESLKGKLPSIKEGLVLRRSLIAFQFATATIVFTGAIIITQQVNLFFGKDLGFNKDYVISVAVPRNWTPDGVKRMEYIRSQLVQLPVVSDISLSYEVPNGNSSGVFALRKLGADSLSAVQSQSLFTDEYYASTYNIPLVAGSFYGQPGAVSDSLKIVINEKMSAALGWKNPEEAIGQQVINNGGNRVFTIAGVVKDFHFGTMQQDIQPVAFYHVRAFTAFRVFSIRLKPGDIAGSIDRLQKEWSALLPGAPFEYTFMDETLKNLYRTELRLKKASYVASTLSIVIVLLGIFGLVYLNIQKRTKEIGIRKVLGAPVSLIVALFMKDILWTVIIAGLVSCPIAYMIMNRWLSDYAFRIPLTPFPFVAAILLLGFLTAILIVLQTIKVALGNPVSSLRTE